MHLLLFLLALYTILMFSFLNKLFLINNCLIPKRNCLYRHIMFLILADIGKSNIKVDSAIKLRNTLLKALFKSSNSTPYVLKALTHLTLLIIEWFNLLHDVLPVEVKKWRVLAHSEELTLQVFIAVFVKVAEVLRFHVDQGNKNFFWNQVTVWIPWLRELLMKSLSCWKQLIVELSLLSINADLL